MMCHYNILTTYKAVPLFYVVSQLYINKQKTLPLLYDESQKYIKNECVLLAYFVS
jgi:hypothetical protein